jgi:hypothetical protein
MPDIGLRMPVVLGLDVPNLLDWGPTWMVHAGRLIWWSLVLLVGVGTIAFLARRPKSPEPSTWAQSMAGAVIVFFLMIVAYGTIPHEWITFADGYLNWGKDTFFVQNSSWFPFDINRQALRDIIVVVIYVVMLSGNIALVAMWQKRPVREPEPEETAPEPAAERTPAGTSAYGRPVTQRG